MDLPYGLYMAECEGYLDTQESKINKIIKDLKDNIPLEKVVNGTLGELVSDYGLDPDTLTNLECERICAAARMRIIKCR